MPSSDHDERAIEPSVGADGRLIQTQHVSSFSADPLAPGTHEAILHGLNQWLPTTHSWVDGGKTFLGIENFRGTEPLWDGVPAIFVPGPPKHPSNAALREDPAAEIARIGGRICGAHMGTAIHAVGTPRLTTFCNFTDPEVQALHTAGYLGHSTGYDARTYPDGRLSGQVEPSHILYFDTRHGVPNDPKIMYLNLGETNMADDETKGLLQRILAKLEGPQPAAHTNVQPPDDSARLIEQANLAKVAAETEAADLKARLAEFENLEAKRKQEAADARWVEMLNILPKGMTHKADEAALRSEFEADPVAFAVKAVHANTADHGKQAQGASYVNATAPGATDEERLNKLGIPSISIAGGE